MPSPPGNGHLVITCVARADRSHRVWTFRYRKQDLNGEMTFGEPPALPLERARTKASDLIELVRQHAAFVYGGSPTWIQGAQPRTRPRSA